MSNGSFTTIRVIKCKTRGFPFRVVLSPSAEMGGFTEIHGFQADFKRKILIDMTRDGGGSGG